MKWIIFTVLLIILMLSSIVFAQRISFVSNTEQSAKIEKIDKEIAEAQSDKTNGMIKLGAGIIVQLVGLAFIPSSSDVYDYSYYGYGTSSTTGNATLFWLCLGVGSVLEIWGAYEWWDAASTLIVLRAKRYDISFQPTIIKNSYGVVLGIALGITF
jgi:hypothetical protein